ncbi:glycerol uptake facilitator-like aquaporin [Arthrobacter sp. UYEF20]
MMIVVGSGIAAQQLSPNDDGRQLLQNSNATVLGLTVLILVLGPVSGTHFNPVVSITDWILGRRNGTGLTLPELGTYVVAHTVGAISGSVVANAMYEASTSISVKDRATTGHLLGEVVATTQTGPAPVPLLTRGLRQYIEECQCCGMMDT